MLECRRCRGNFVSVEKDVCVGWMLEGDRCTCYECGHTWVEHEHSVVEDDDAKKEL